jgi:ABC-2 type transport system permease protein
MRNALAIARKELSIYFTTPWAYVVFTAMAALSSMAFLAMLQTFKDVQDYARAMTWARLPADYATFRNLTDGVVVNLWGFIAVVVLFVAPLLSMGLFAREKRNGTFELLMTAPVRPVEIVLGKYLGALGIVGATLGLTILFPIILAIFGQSESGSALEWSTVLLGYGGLLLWGGTCMAVGMFISILTRSEMLAAVLTFVIALLWYLVKGLTHSAEEPWRSVASHISFSTQLEGLTKGVLDVKSIVFFASVIFLSLFLTHRAVEAHRWA